MELSEVGRRIIVHHRVLILVFALVGATVAFAAASAEGSRYEASARVSLGVPAGTDTDQIASTADSVAAIATSPGVLRDVAARIGAPGAIASSDVHVDRIADSDVLLVTVASTSPQVAVEGSNDLADAIVSRWKEALSAPTQKAQDALTIQVNDLTEQVDGLNTEIGRLNVAIASTTDTARAARLTDRRSRLTAQRDDAESQRLVVQTQIANLVANATNGAAPDVVDTAVRATAADHNIVAGTALGALIGLILGLGVAAGIETLQPSIVGVDAIADALGAPVLGTLRGSEDFSTARLGVRLRLAADRADVSDVELVPVGGVPADAVSRLAESSAGQDGLTVTVFGNTSDIPRDRAAFIAVVRPTIKRADLRDISDLQVLTSWPIVGVIAMSQSWLPRRTPPVTATASEARIA